MFGGIYVGSQTKSLLSAGKLHGCSWLVTLNGKQHCCLVAFDISAGYAMVVLLVSEQRSMSSTCRVWLVGQLTWLETASQSGHERGAPSTLHLGGMDSSSAHDTCHVHATWK